jgi:hypothetical protein
VLNENNESSKAPEGEVPATPETHQDGTVKPPRVILKAIGAHIPAEELLKRINKELEG